MKFLVLGPVDSCNKELIFKAMSKIEMRMANRGTPLSEYVSLNLPGVDSAVKKYAESISIKITISTLQFSSDIEYSLFTLGIQFVVVFNPDKEEHVKMREIVKRMKITMAEVKDEVSIKYIR